MTTKTKLDARWPDGPIEWQAAADSAELLLTLAAAQDYGLIDKRLPINVGRCSAILLQAEQRGIVPRPGPATNASLLTTIKSPMPVEGMRHLPKSVGNGAVRISVKAQRISMPMDDARQVVLLRRPEDRARYAQVDVNAKHLQIHLVEADRYYLVDLTELIHEVALGDGSYG